MNVHQDDYFRHLLSSFSEKVNVNEPFSFDLETKNGEPNANRLSGVLISYSNTANAHAMLLGLGAYLALCFDLNVSKLDSVRS